ncbi:hypothetical protein U1Q18_028199 [Sarracenia purpurea var. burkii]
MESRINVNGHNATGTITTDIVPDHEIQMTASRASPSTSNNASATLVKKKGKKKKPTKSQENWLEKTQNTLMIVATLIAGMALQVGVNHPSGGSVWQQDGDTHTGAVGASTFSLYSYEFFLICNTIGFVASFIIILIFVSDFPLRWRVIIWVMRVIMWVSLTAMIVTYLSSITMLAPNKGIVEVNEINMEKVTIDEVIFGPMFCIVTAAVFNFVILLSLRDCIMAAAMLHGDCSLNAGCYCFHIA